MTEFDKLREKIDAIAANVEAILRWTLRATDKLDSIEGKEGSLMATVDELTTSLQALSDALAKVRDDAAAEFAKLEGELANQGVDPALLDPLKATIDALTQAANDADAAIPTN